MTLVDIRVPQLGEGLQEALVVTLLKTPGANVAKDEPVFEMETDKARVAVEAPCAGLLREWLVREGEVVPIGAVIGRMESLESVDVDMGEAAHLGPRAAASKATEGTRRNRRTEAVGPSVRIPPRTRAHARALGLSEDEMERIPAPTGKLLPADLDQYVARRSPATAADTTETYRERLLSAQQRALTFRFRRSAQLVIPATITCPVAWAVVERALEIARGAHPDVPIGALEVIAYAVARSAGAHPNFRSVLLGDDRVREYPHVALGIAVHRPEGDLVTAVVPQADTLSLPELARVIHRRIASAMEGRDQTAETVQVVLTYLGASQVSHAVPTLVAPAVATLFVGAPIGSGVLESTGTGALCVTFDHRLINGVEAAEFLGSVRGAVERLGTAGGAEHADPTRESSLRSAAREAAGVPGAPWASDPVAHVEVRVRDRVVDLLGVPVTTADVRRPLRSLGMTSVMSVALSKGLEQDLGFPVPATLVWNYPTIEAIARYLAERLDAGAGSSSAPDRATDEEQELGRLLEEVEGLSDADASRLLREEERPGDSRND